MKVYTNFEPEDFAQDDYFICWVNSVEIETETFWQNWLETYPFKRNDVEIARQLVIMARHLPAPQISGQEISAMRASVFERIGSLEHTELHVRPISSLWRWAAAAAVAGLMLLAGWYTFYYQSAPGYLYSEQVTNAAHQYELIEVVNLNKQARLVNLPDGSSVILKKGSKLSYPSYFKKDLREIYLTGEAFFEVAKDPERPFYVFANEVVTKVLGTSFNVKAFPEDKEILVSVKTGKVSVFSAQEPGGNKHFDTKRLEGLVLAPNELAIFEKEKKMFNRQVNDGRPKNFKTATVQEMTFEYEEVPVGEILAQLEKAYQIKIVYDKTVIAKCPVTASLTDEPLPEKLSLICKAVRSSYEIVNGEIIISGKGCD